VGYSYAWSYSLVLGSRGQLKCDGTRSETTAKRTSPFKSAGGRQFSRLLAAEVCASAVVMLDTPCSEVECKTAGYPLHPPVSPSVPLPCFTVCHHISAVVYSPGRGIGPSQRPLRFRRNWNRQSRQTSGRVPIPRSFCRKAVSIGKGNCITVSTGSNYSSILALGVFRHGV